MAKRFYAFDAARGFMMSLGIVAHAILLANYVVQPTGVSAESERQISWWVYSAIHLFRMPTFFLLAGFFAAMLLHRTGYLGFVVSRFKRLVSPMLAALLVIAAVIIPFGCDACQSLGGQQLAGAPRSGFFQIGLLYLWFIYDLVIISHVMLGLAWAFGKLPQTWRDREANLASRFRLGTASMVVLAFFSALVPNIADPQGEVRISMSYLPDLALLGFFGLFFLAGWVAFQNRTAFIASVKARAAMNISIGIAFEVVHRLSWQDPGMTWFSWLFACLSMWFLAVGFVGLSQWIFARENKAIQYLADASYWVYLFHPALVLLFVVGFNWLQFDLLLNVVLSSVLAFAVTLASYAWLVRDTILGKWLSGRRRGKIGQAQREPIALGELSS